MLKRLFVVLYILAGLWAIFVSQTYLIDRQRFERSHISQRYSDLMGSLREAHDNGDADSARKFAQLAQVERDQTISRKIQSEYAFKFIFATLPALILLAVHYVFIGFRRTT